MARKPGKISAARDMGERHRLRCRQRARSAHVDIGADIGRGYLNVERLARRREHFGNVPGRLDRPGERWREDGAAVNRDHVMGPERSKPNLEHVARAAPGGEYGAAASLAMGAEQVIDG